jgi:transcriptional regulator with XRE-family HTH domain
MMKTERLFRPEVFGERLRVCRKARDLNQQDLAKHMHVAQGWISELENGKQTRLEAETVFRFALALNVSADYLLGLASEMERAPTPPSRKAAQSARSTTPAKC